MNRPFKTGVQYDTFPDETIFSILARYCHLSGYRSIKDTLSNVNLSLHRQFDSELPSFIPSISTITGQQELDILYNHSALNYYKFFSIENRFNDALIAMKSGNVGNIFAKLSIIANRLGEKSSLHYCPVCANENTEKFGVAYWHRKHQLAGVTACIYHQTRLLTIPRSRKKLQLPPLSKSAKECSSKAALLAELSNCLLLHDVTEVADHAKLIIAYKYRLRELGFATKNLHIHQANLRESILKYWHAISLGAEIEAVFYDSISLPFPQNVLYGIGTHHPLKHLLLIGFLFDDLDHFFSFYNRTANYDDTCIRCQRTQKEASIENSMYTIDAKALPLLMKGISLRKVAENVGCSVGHTKALAKSHLVPIKTRPKKIYNAEIRAIWLKLYMGHSTQKIAKSFSISVGAVEHILSAQHQLVEIRSKIRYLKALRLHREHMVNFLSDNQFATRNQARLQINSDYSWLFKNDKSWLYKVMPNRVTTH